MGESCSRRLHGHETGPALPPAGPFVIEVNAPSADQGRADRSVPAIGRIPLVLLHVEAKRLIGVKSDAVDAARNLFQIFFVKLTLVCRFLKNPR